MRFEIGRYTPTQPVTPPAAPSRAATVDPGPAPVPADSAVAVETTSASPPAELHAAIAQAATAYDALEASGSRLHFALDSQTGTLTVEVHDLAGNVTSTISGTDTLRLAAGEHLN
jgi:hypothetical protein